MMNSKMIVFAVALLLLSYTTSSDGLKVQVSSSTVNGRPTQVGVELVPSSTAEVQDQVVTGVPVAQVSSSSDTVVGEVVPVVGEVVSSNTRSRGAAQVDVPARSRIELRHGGREKIRNVFKSAKRGANRAAKDAKWRAKSFFSSKVNIILVC